MLRVKHKLSTNKAGNVHVMQHRGAFALPSLPWKSNKY